MAKEIDDLRERCKNCKKEDIDGMLKLIEDLIDYQIKILPLIIDAETRAGKKAKLRKRFLEILAEKHGV